MSRPLRGGSRKDPPRGGAFERQQQQKPHTIMGHDISAFTRKGDRIGGPGFGRAWFPHYAYLDAEHHNEGISGDGESEEMTPERLLRAITRIEGDLQRLEAELNELDKKTVDGSNPSTSPGYIVSWNEDGEVEFDDYPALDRRWWINDARKDLEELRDFLKRCVDEDVVRIKFW